VAVRTRERRLALTVPTVTHAVRTFLAFPTPRSNGMPDSLRHYQIRLRRSRRLRYRIARSLLVALGVGLMILVFAVASR
jgi:hypothetical protein